MMDTIDDTDRQDLAVNTVDARKLGNHEHTKNPWETVLQVMNVLKPLLIGAINLIYISL